MTQPAEKMSMASVKLGSHGCTAWPRRVDTAGLRCRCTGDPAPAAGESKWCDSRRSRTAGKRGAGRSSAGGLSARSNSAPLADVDAVASLKNDAGVPPSAGDGAPPASAAGGTGAAAATAAGGAAVAVPLAAGARAPTAVPSSSPPRFDLKRSGAM